MIYVVEELAHHFLHQGKHDQNLQKNNLSKQVENGSDEPGTTTSSVANSTLDLKSTEAADLPHGDFAHEEIPADLFDMDEKSFQVHSADDLRHCTGAPQGADSPQGADTP
jgi:hypothetical protein